MIMLSAGYAQTIRVEGETAYPNECCGALIGDIDHRGVKIVRHLEVIGNAREGEEQHHRFLITPEDMMNAEKSARSKKLDVIGFYHSHPDHPAVPSDYDKDHALPFYSYIIVSVEQGRAQGVTSWELSENRAAFLPEVMVKEDQP